MLRANVVNTVAARSYAGSAKLMPFDLSRFRFRAGGSRDQPAQRAAGIELSQDRRVRAVADAGNIDQAAGNHDGIAGRGITDRQQRHAAIAERRNQRTRRIILGQGDFLFAAAAHNHAAVAGHENVAAADRDCICPFRFLTPFLGLGSSNSIAAHNLLVE